ncbi:MAG: FecR domain-containing protein [Gemmatimonadetes bacterium]|nr:FecR domain-containing protein [Gemmatimonadota bacterium]
MPVSLPAVGGATLTALRNGEESALEKIFRADYDAILKETAAELGDEGSVPRLAEDVMLSVWEQRATFDTPEKLEAFIHAQVHASVLREKRRRGSLERRAAFQSGSGQVKHSHAAVTVDEAWKHVYDFLHKPAVDTAALDHLKVEQARHGAASHLATVGKRRSWKGPVLAGVILVAIVGAMFPLLDKMGADAAVHTALNNQDAVTMVVPPGRRAKTTLEDSSLVSVGSETKLTYPKNASEKFRAAGVDGTASFSVPANKRPFEARVKDVQLKLNSADFAVRSYTHDDTVLVKVTKGSVLVKDGKNERTLNAGEAAGVTKDGTIFTPKPEAVTDAFAWVADSLTFTNTPVKEIVSEVRRWYDYVIDVRDKDLLERPVSVTAPLTSTKEIIAALEKGANAKFGFDGQTPILRDAVKKK